MIRKNYPVIVGNRVVPEGDAELASVVGPLCTPLDVLADKMALGHAHEGDLIVVLQSWRIWVNGEPYSVSGSPSAGRGVGIGRIACELLALAAGLIGSANVNKSLSKRPDPR